MSYTISITDRAAIETEVAALYYEEVKPGLGISFLDRLDEVYAKLAQYPEAYSFVDEQKIIRDIKVKRFPFVVIYKINPGAVLIISVHHTNKQPIE